MNARLLLDKLARADTVDFEWNNDAMHDMGLPTVRMAVSDLKWHFKKKFWNTSGKVGAGGGDLRPQQVLDDPAEYPEHAERILDADLSFPLHVWQNQAGKWIILDGLHRLAKAFLEGKEYVQVKKVPKGRKSEILENLEPSPANVQRAKAFVLRKWNERRAEREQDPVADLTNACKFCALFAQKVFGGQIAGNWYHAYVKLPDGQPLDLTDAAGVGAHQRTTAAPAFKGAYHHDPKFLKGREFKTSLASCEERVDGWVREFLGSVTEGGASAMWQQSREPHEPHEPAPITAKEGTVKYAGQMQSSWNFSNGVTVLGRVRPNGAGVTVEMIHSQNRGQGAAEAALRWLKERHGPARPVSVLPDAKLFWKKMRAKGLCS